MPLHPLSKGQTQKFGIVCRLGPGPGLTPALHTVRPSVPPSSPFPSTKHPCNGTPRSPSARPRKTVTDPRWKVTRARHVQLNTPLAASHLQECHIGLRASMQQDAVLRVRALPESTASQTPRAACPEEPCGAGNYGKVKNKSFLRSPAPPQTSAHMHSAQPANTQIDTPTAETVGVSGEPSGFYCIFIREKTETCLNLKCDAAHSKLGEAASNICREI